ncbi:hypothetical protein M406DRAFT_226793, partial [Cryphonectria parasitica EP155]
MADLELMNILVVGGNAVSAFLSWRLQATNACDVTLVWKSGYEHVAQYGISFKSAVFGNERFKPRRVVRSPEEALSRKEGSFDYVVLCVKALPDIYDLASVIDSVVVPNHTCILINTTNTIGLEAAIEERYPTNVVLSLVAGADLAQLGQSEFEHKGSTELWVGPAKRNSTIPATIQDDMASALAITLSSGQVDAKVSPNIRQHQYERVIGPIAFHPASVIFETANYSELLAKPAVKTLVSGVIDELLELAAAQGCNFDTGYKEKVMDEMTRQAGTESVMWQDFQSRRPMEVESFLGSPVKLAQEANVSLPRIETLYAMLHHLNVVNRNRPRIDVTAAAAGPPPPSSSPTSMAMPSPAARMSMSQAPRPMPPNGMPNGNGMPRRPRGPSQMGPPLGMRRPSSNTGPQPNGYGRPPMNGIQNGSHTRQQPSRRGSIDEGLQEEFGHLGFYDDEIPEGGEPITPDQLAIRERELQLRQRDLALRDQEMRMRGPPGRGMMGPPPPGMRRGPPPPRGPVYDDDDDEDYFDPNLGPPVPMIDPDNFDMMSVTSRKNRHTPKPSASQFRKNPEADSMPGRSSRFRPNFASRNRSSQMGTQTPNLGSNILDDPMMKFTDNRYGHVDRSAMQAESRANSMTSQAGNWQNGLNGPPNGPPNGMFQRRASQSPGYAPSMRGGNGRPSPPNGYGPPGMNGRPSPPNGVRQPVPQYPPGHGNAVAPQQVEQHAGVSNLHPPSKGQNVPSLTGSASASAGSGESTNLDTPSAHSSQSSL